ncbi:hypothetical protein TNCV_5059751 [Trichonephila clavipes]|nr:hypothetical protein TNCV_5059751 [Trichonephila clavipes]
MANNQSVRRNLDAFTRGRTHWEVGGRPQQCCDEVWLRAKSSELPHSIVSHDFGDNFKLQELLSGGVSAVVVHEEPHPQMTDRAHYVLQAGQKKQGGETAGRNRQTR